MRKLAATAVLVVLGALPASAQVPAAGEPGFTFRYSVKASGLLSRMPDAPVLFPTRTGGASLWRFRVEPGVRVGDTVRLELAFEQRLRVFSSASAVLGGPVRPGAPGPYRLRPLDWRIGSSAHAEWRGEIDRAAIHWRVRRASVAIGRQAIGWGRGVAFSAVDLFAPFTPLEADREWRRGVDAVRADVPLTDRVSLDGVGAFGADLDHSIVAARLRGYTGNVDVEVLGGRRARDPFGGVSTSAAIGDIEIHGELAVFAAGRTVVKALAGGSYRVPLGHGLLVHAEYHYSGFGAPSAGAIVPLLADPAFQERYLRGDTQILGRHAVAGLASYEYGPRLMVAGEWLLNPLDRSGVLIPSATLTCSDRVSVLVSGYAPYGAAPADAVLRSQFGASPFTVFVQLRVYR